MGKLQQRVGRLEQKIVSGEPCPGCGYADERPRKIVMTVSRGTIGEPNDESKACPVCGRPLVVVLRVQLPNPTGIPMEEQPYRVVKQVTVQTEP